MSSIDKLNRMRAMAGLPPVGKETREKLVERQLLMEAANHRAPDKVIGSIAKEHCHVKSLEKSGDDDKDYHEIPCWALKNALKAAFKAGYESKGKKAPVKESADASSAESKEGGSKPEFDPKGGDPVYKDGEDYESKDAESNPDAQKGKSAENYKTPKNKKAKEVIKEDGETEDTKVEEEMQAEGSSEGYNNPKGTDLKADKSSGANAKKGDAYKDVPHKDDSESAKSEDKGKAGLKKIKEAESEDATVWGKDYNHDGRVDKNESPDQLKVDDPNEEAKVTVPSQYKSALKEEIKRLRDEAEKVAIRDPIGADFYANAAIVFEGLLDHLETGTRRSLMLAQIDMNRVMSPMITRLPNEVYMFIVRGGKPAALTELFKEVKVKKDKGADLSKEDYTT